jgi:FG-GAP-like repeat
MLLTLFLLLDCVGWNGFRAPVRYSSSADNVVLARDLNGDGMPELLASGNHVDELNAFSLFVNRGDGTFEPERPIASGFGEELESIDDQNGDGIPDLLASDYWSNGIVLYSGSNQLDYKRTPYTTATHGGPSLFADYDGDGTKDVISLSFGSGNPVRVHLFRGDRDGTLTREAMFEMPLANGNTPSIRERAGALEILVGERSGHLAILRYENGALSQSTITTAPRFDLSSTFADVNGDGLADIVYTTEPEPGDPQEPVFVMLANADGSFGDRRPLAGARKPVLPVNVAVRDLDGDRRPDIVVSDFRTASLFFFRGKGDGEFGEAQVIDAGGPVNSFTLADLNGDGAIDIVTANDDHTVSVVLNDGVCPPPRRRAVLR